MNFPHYTHIRHFPNWDVEYGPQGDEVNLIRRKNLRSRRIICGFPARSARLGCVFSGCIGLLPDGGCRVVTSGIVLVLAAPAATPKVSHAVKFTGRTGIVVETLLSGGARRWSVRDLVQAS